MTLVALLSSGTSTTTNSGCIMHVVHLRRSIASHSLKSSFDVTQRPVRRIIILSDMYSIWTNILWDYFKRCEADVYNFHQPPRQSTQEEQELGLHHTQFQILLLPSPPDRRSVWQSSEANSPDSSVRVDHSRQTDR